MHTHICMYTISCVCARACVCIYLYVYNRGWKPVQWKWSISSASTRTSIWCAFEFFGSFVNVQEHWAPWVACIWKRSMYRYFFFFFIITWYYFVNYFYHLCNSMTVWNTPNTSNVTVTRARYIHCKKTLPWGFRKNYILVWNYERETLYTSFKQCGISDDTKKMIEAFNNQHWDRLVKLVKNTGFKHSSRKAWYLFHRLGFDVFSKSNFPKINPSLMANRMLEMHRASLHK